MIRLLLLLLSVTLSLSVSIDEQIADLTARKFWGQLVNKIELGTKEEVMDIIFRKHDYFFPGMMTEEELYQMFLEEYKGEKSEETKKIWARVDKTLKKRYAQLDNEAKEFIDKLVKAAEESYKTNATAFERLKNYKEKFDEVQASLAALSDSSRDGLLWYFPTFGKLTEMKAVAVVGERAYKNFVKVCNDLPGYHRCKNINNFKTHDSLN